MRLVSLNIWGAIVRDPFLDFIKNHKDVDIFCFQELYEGMTEKLSADQKDGVGKNICSEIKKLLPNHQMFFRPVVENVYGIGAFIHKDTDILGEGEIIIHTNTKYPNNTGHHSRNMQWIDMRMDNKLYSVLNVHGLWNGGGKTDTPDRIAQSQRIKEFMDTLNTPKILCGDFNLRPDTESLAILEKGMTNLVKKYDIRSTRTSFYTKPEKFADYILVSPDITVNHFGVLKDEVSDHSPLLLDFN
ncbi:MAG: endonuclease/exonuclease/phosphatase family protein [bacterium]|nr:endonuclease/exonuclease/phosphatase family protein [bacterium]